MLSAAFMFSFSTVFLKIAMAPPFSASPMVATFVRYLIGALVFGLFVGMRSGVPKANRFGLVVSRAILNTVAVVLLFTAIKYTTITKANLLNLTYPAFVFLVAPFITHERSNWHQLVFLVTALAGAWLIVIPAGGFRLAEVNIGDLLALASGVVSGFAIADLRQARKFDSTETILFYQMNFGALACAGLMIPSFSLPTLSATGLLVVTGLISLAGQYFLTKGYRYINASLGSIVLGSGILFSAGFGITIFHDPVSPRIIIGGLLILVSLVGVSGIFDRWTEGVPFCSH
jgi:drug/metabolite transporter (DMT)-like permease